MIGRLLFLVALMLVALIVVYTIRAARARRAAEEIDKGWYPVKIERQSEAVIALRHYGRNDWILAYIPYNSLDYSDRILDEWGKATVKAEDLNTTDFAIGNDAALNA